MHVVDVKYLQSAHDSAYMYVVNSLMFIVTEQFIGWTRGYVCVTVGLLILQQQCYMYHVNIHTLVHNRKYIHSYLFPIAVYLSGALNGFK